MATQQKLAQALEIIPEAKSLINIVQEAAKEVKLNPLHLVRIAATQIRLNSKLAQCTPASFVGALIVLEQVGLEPVAGRAYLLPFYNNRKTGQIINGKEQWHKVLEVQALIGYKGYSDLFYRHEVSLSIQAQTVHKNDKFEYEYGTQAYLRHKPAEGDRGPATHYYCMAKLRNGGELFLVMTREECIEHGKKHSKVYDKKNGNFMPGTPWVDDVDSMCKKTVLLQLSKNLPLSIETQKALSIDETSREYRPGVGDLTTIPDTTDWTEEPIETTAVEESKEKPPVIKFHLPQNILDSIAIARSKVGDKIFQKVLGEEICVGSIEEIPDIATANKLLALLGKEYAKK